MEGWMKSSAVETDEDDNKVGADDGNRTRLTRRERIDSPLACQWPTSA